MTLLNINASPSFIHHGILRIDAREKESGLLHQVAEKLHVAFSIIAGEELIESDGIYI